MESTVQVHLPFSIREEQNGTPDHYCHSIVNQAPKQLGFISDIGSTANSLFSVVRMYVSARVYTVYRIHKRCIQETVYSLGCEDMGVVVKLEEWTLVVVGPADNAGVRRVK